MPNIKKAWAAYTKNRESNCPMIGKSARINDPSKMTNPQTAKNRKELRKYLEKMDLSNSVILVKGSRGMKMEEFVSVIQATTN